MVDDKLASRKTARFALTPGVGNADVSLDGQAIGPFLRRVTVDVKAGHLPEVFLELTPGVEIATIECEALVTAIVEVPQEPAVAMVAFLKGLDPDELDRCILEALGMGGPTTYGQAAFAVLRKWAGSE